MTKFKCNLTLEDATDIQFTNLAGANTGKIESDGDNLVLSNAVGDILLGDGASDVYIGDGTNSVDILFEVSGSLSAESGAALTLGGEGGTLALGSAISSAATILGDLTVGIDDTGHDVKFFGATSGAYMLWDQSEDGLVIKHPTDDAGLEIYTVSGSSPTTSQFKVGRDSNQYFGVYTEDRTAHLIHRQDETDSGAMYTSSELWGGGSGNDSWTWKHGTNTGGSLATVMTLDKAGQLTITGEIEGGSLDINGAATIDGTTTITSSSTAALKIVGGTGVDTTGSFVLRQNGDGAGNGMAITSSNATSHRLWKDASGNFNIGSSSNSNAFRQDTTGNVTIEGTIGSGAITSTGQITGTELEGTSLDINGNADIAGTLTVGVDDTGHDVFFYGATSGKYMKWDQSEDNLFFPDNTNILFGNGNDATIGVASDNLVIANNTADKDIIFQADNGSGGVTAYLTLDGSAGLTTVSKNMKFFDSIPAVFGTGADSYVRHTGSNMEITNTAGNIVIDSATNDADIIFKGTDGGADITALTLDMSDAGTAIFNHNVNLPDSGQLNLGASGDLSLLHDGTDGYITEITGDLKIGNTQSNKDIIFYGNDDGSTIAALTLDMSNHGNAIFSGGAVGPAGRYFMLQNAAGNQTYPVYSFQSDGNTGMMSAAADTLNLVTGGTTRLTLTNTAATFAGTITGTTLTGTSLDINGAADISGVLSGGKVFPRGVYLGTTTTGFLIQTSITTNAYAMMHGTIKLEQFNSNSFQTIEFSATTLSNGTVGTKAGVANIAVTIKLFNYNSVWYVWVPTPSTYTTCTAYIGLANSYQGQAEPFNEVLAVTNAAVPSSGVSNSVDLVTLVKATTDSDISGDTTGNAATATKLAATKTIAGVAFDGSTNISLNNNAITNGAGYTTYAGPSDADEGTKGIIEIASAQEATEGGNEDKAVTPAGLAAHVESRKVHELTAPTAALAMNSQKVTGVADPTAAQDAATKAYTDAKTWNWNDITAGTVPTFNQDTTGRAAGLTAAVNIGGVAFNGTAAINLPGVNIGGNQNTTGSAETLRVPRAINGVDFDGSAAITIPTKAYFEFKGYGTSDGTNYEMGELMTVSTAPFNHDTSTGSNGLTAQTIQTLMRSGGTVMPHAGTLTAFFGWNTSAGSGTVDIGLFKVTPTDDTAGDLTPVLLVNKQTTASGNAKPNSFSESSFSVAFAAGDIIYSAVKGGTASKTWYFTSTLEVQWS